MKTHDEIFDLIRSSEMNNWVGGADPEAVGNACVSILERHFLLNGSTRYLDFGCGVGRVLVSLLKKYPDIGPITGMDIMPQVINFCREHIASSYLKTSFELLQGENNHYNKYINEPDVSLAISSEEAARIYTNYFTSVFSFSVFTHLEAEDFKKLLKFLAGVTIPGGEILLTCFIINPQSKRAIADKSCRTSFENYEFENERKIFVGNKADRLSFIGFDQSLIEEWVMEAGLFIKRIEYGAWSGIVTGSLHDVIVCQKP